MRKPTEGLIQIFTAALSCVVDEGGAVYASTPITNGPILLEHFTMNPLLSQMNVEELRTYVQKEIVPVNVASAKIFAGRLRGAGVGVVIDPSCFFSDSLSQEEYLKLWGHVIIRFASAVWFNDGWSFSKGCVTEYCIAAENKIPTFDDMGSPLPPAKALEKIARAIDQHVAVGLDVSFLEKKFTSLETIINY
jgi:hypothetical protein